MTLTWTKSKNGWGLTEYRTTINGVTYVAKKTGGRFAGWDCKVDEGWGGKRVASGSTLRSVQEQMQMQATRGAF